jgi:hypothetical protein
MDKACREPYNTYIDGYNAPNMSSVASDPTLDMTVKEDAKCIELDIALVKHWIPRGSTVGNG